MSQYVKYDNIRLFHADAAYTNSAICAWLKEAGYTYTNRLTALQTKLIKVRNRVGSQVRNITY